MYLSVLGKMSVKMQLNRLKFITILEMALNVVLSCDSFFVHINRSFLMVRIH
jgi:hypothetical protein